MKKSTWIKKSNEFISNKRSGFLIFLNNFSALFLCKINVLDIFNMDDFFLIFVPPQSTEILIESATGMVFRKKIETHFFSFSINNQITYSIFVTNEFIDFLKSIRI